MTQIDDHASSLFGPNRLVEAKISQFNSQQAFKGLRGTNHALALQRLENGLIEDACPINPSAPQSAPCALRTMALRRDPDRRPAPAPHTDPRCWARNYPRWRGRHGGPRDRVDHGRRPVDTAGGALDCHPAERDAQCRRHLPAQLLPEHRLDLRHHDKWRRHSRQHAARRRRRRRRWRPQRLRARLDRLRHEHPPPRFERSTVGQLPGVRLRLLFQRVSELRWQFIQRCFHRRA